MNRLGGYKRQKIGFKVNKGFITTKEAFKGQKQLEKINSPNEPVNHPSLTVRQLVRDSENVRLSYLQRIYSHFQMD